MPSFDHERLLTGPVAGVDEAGRGPWAGPVVAAAVMFRAGAVPAGLDDSKQLSAKARSKLVPLITATADTGIGVATVEEIDALNIRRATHLAMLRAIEALAVSPTTALVDGNDAPKLPCVVKTLVKGDSLSLSIAAASILAKEHRDALMRALDSTHPGYGWGRNMGYGTAAHAAALNALGPTVHHRKSFAPVKLALEQWKQKESRRDCHED